KKNALYNKFSNFENYQNEDKFLKFRINSQKEDFFLLIISKKFPSKPFLSAPPASSTIISSIEETTDAALPETTSVNSASRRVVTIVVRRNVKRSRRRWAVKFQNVINAVKIDDDVGVLARQTVDGLTSGTLDHLLNVVVGNAARETPSISPGGAASIFSSGNVAAGVAL
uniref:Uncharacterized protein n=1 Tax=Romanomermis culicivorax TaxID=13658 RepID=A0A915K728_ROMCU